MLLADDVRYLNGKHYEYTCEAVGQSQLLVIQKFPLPEGLVPDATDLLLEIPAGYPDAGLDMFWVHPEVRIAATGAYPQAANVFEPKLHGISWQRFSRHGYAWQAGHDSIASYLGWVRRSLETDAGRLAA